MATIEDNKAHKELRLQNDRLLAALKRCTNLLARFSPVGEMSPDVREARVVIAQAKRNKI